MCQTAKTLGSLAKRSLTSCYTEKYALFMYLESYEVKSRRLKVAPCSAALDDDTLLPEELSTLLAFK